MMISMRKKRMSTTMKSFIRFSLLNAMMSGGDRKMVQSEKLVLKGATPASTARCCD